MDDSWRMRMGMPALPRRRSMEDTSSGRSVFGNEDTLDPEDFADVYGGPPRSVLLRKFAADYVKPGSANFYEEVFRQRESMTPARKGGRSLPAFRIPARSEGFFGDIFGSDHDDHLRRSRERSRPNSNAKSKSKSNSSSVLSSEELSPLRPVIGDDVALSSFASKLRPISVPCRWNSSTMMPEEHAKKQAAGKPAFPRNRSFHTEHQFMENEYHDNFKSFYNGFPSRRVSSPETISIEPNSYRSVKVSTVDDPELNSSSSAVSSLHQDLEAETGIPDHVLSEQEDDEVMSSYVIEINCDHREGTSETVSIDETIAWFREKSQTQSTEKDLSLRHHDNEQPVEMEGRPTASEFSHQPVDGHGVTRSTEEAGKRNWTAEEEEESEKDMEVELYDEYIRLWSAGKETNIKLLISKLHQILWPDSGWQAIPLTSLTDSSQVKKAYQKARLCLHPDKLQQRGATLPQKYVAEKAFSILQNAWAAFISQDVFLN
ncbi:hypothetical protein I3843_09G115200 [Carya illinoinensis]|uniref:Uncharacterized protein n=2 Tax=Carya illinoinensis TaxID=32201 RepID=A0A922E484_CARIL|nr:uncharacterized protein LOC122277785 [Carya illinoinensis]KAG6695847.1 hypothetical protein I3842_09G117500 [Carya illinoinensis]KAG7963389.1 hypothetical protein I3843_09G115200 [Carya illinoinensis]